MFVLPGNMVYLKFVVLLLLALGYSPVIASQVTSAEGVDSEVERAPEEIIVYGQKNIVILQNELYRAEESFFDLYNMLNSDDAFDVKCKKHQKSIQERRRAHRCVPSFALEYEAWVASRYYRSMRNGFVGMLDPAFANLEYQARVRVQERKMWAEIRDLIETNPEFIDEIKELQRANRALVAEKSRRGPCPKLFCRD